MGILLMILFAALETALAVLSLTKFSDKKDWLRIRVYVRGIEMILFIITMLLPMTTFDFKYKLCFFVLLARLLRNGIMHLCKRNSIEGKRSKAEAVFSAIFATLSLVLALIPSLMFAEYDGLETSGPYKVNQAKAILTDTSRLETFENDGSNREVVATFYYPEVGEGSTEEYPLVIFSHGAFGYSQSNFSMYQELASNGYVVAALDHPYHAFFCKDTNGKTILVNFAFINDVMMVNDDNTPENDIYDYSSKWIKLRVDDMNFVVDSLEAGKANPSEIDAWYTEDEKAKEGVKKAMSMVDIEHIGVMGHSLGGATSVTVGRIRKDIGAVVDLDGTMLGEQTGFADGKYSFVEEPYEVPLLVMDSQSHHDQGKFYNVLYVNNYVVEHAKEAYRVYIKDSEHMNFTDLPLFSPVLASKLGTGEVDAEECIRTINSLVLQFMDHSLKGEGEFNPSECY